MCCPSHFWVSYQCNLNVLWLNVISSIHDQNLLALNEKFLSVLFIFLLSLFYSEEAHCCMYIHIKYVLKSFSLRILVSSRTAFLWHLFFSWSVLSNPMKTSRNSVQARSINYFLKSCNDRTNDAGLSWFLPDKIKLFKVFIPKPTYSSFQ